MSAHLERIEFSHLGIGGVLEQNFLRVPVNQREYAWEDTHVSDLLTDFVNAMPDGSYFLGTIVLTKGHDDVPEVSDGQQRLATTTIFLAAIRDYLINRNPDDPNATAIEHDYLRKYDIGKQEIQPKLCLNTQDNDFFIKRILTRPKNREIGVEPTKESHHRIDAAARLAERKVAEIVAPHSDANKVTRLLDWIPFIKNGATVVVLRVPSHLNAFRMFETLNDRGLKASQADLLKNYLLGLAEGRIEEAQRLWAEMIGTLESAGRGDITVTYLHHFLITRHGPMKEIQVLDKVSETIDSKQRALDFLTELRNGANDYIALFSADHRKWNAYSTDTARHVLTINRYLGVEQIRPLMFAVLRYLSIPEAQKAFRLLVFWSVRFLICGSRGGLLDRHYALQAQKIGRNEITTARELTEALRSIIPSDSVFEASFTEARVSAARLARYYLRAMEMMEQEPTGHPELIPSEDEEAVNLEHVLPKNPEDSWPGVEPGEHEAYYKRIGNLVIMAARKNSLIGNSSFSDKKMTLSNSGFVLTQEVGNCEAWGVKQIEERQRRLAALAVKTWPISV